MLRHFRFVFLILALSALGLHSCTTPKSREVTSFNESWKFSLTGDSLASNPDFDDSNWRQLNLPHDWSIEGEFKKEHPATEGGGALPGGVGWYRKEFNLTSNQLEKNLYIQFDGVYMNSEVWINGQYLGKRPFGYISFEYDLTPHLVPGRNVLAVRVDNSMQPNSRWYSGSGIYRNVRLVATNDIHIDQWGTYVKATYKNENASVSIQSTVKRKGDAPARVMVLNRVYKDNRKVAEVQDEVDLSSAITIHPQSISFTNPLLWDLESPNQYELVTLVLDLEGNELDTYTTKFGIRDFSFDTAKGFILNGKQVKVKGVCNHHDLGCLGTAVNARAIERQLQILKTMGVNAIRTSHNPPAPELLDLCDQMGFIVMDEAFDIWATNKSPYDYSLYFSEEHTRDLEDFIKRDRNHPSVVVWSIGNEISDQWKPEGKALAHELAAIVRKLDDRPLTAAMNPPVPGNSIASSGALDIIGYNYHEFFYEKHKENYSESFIATETTSGLMTRGYYDEKSDTIKRWPIRWDLPFYGGNPGNTVSSYDQVSAPWGSTHEDTWRIIKRNDNLSGMFIWTGFDYLGEPTPYTWPSRSSYFGVIDLAGFPKDVYYMYQSEWTERDVLHVFPHWNWAGRDSVDVWAYFNADEVELFLNGRSLGSKTKGPEEFHVMWRVPFEPGEIKAVSKRDGVTILEKSRKTAGDAASITLKADRKEILADGQDLSFVTVSLADANGIEIPIASQKVSFSLDGPGEIVGVDNGDPTSHLSLKGKEMNLFNGLCLVVVKSTSTEGTITLKAQVDGLPDASITIIARRTTTSSQVAALLSGWFD